MNTTNAYLLNQLELGGELRGDLLRTLKAQVSTSHSADIPILEWLFESKVFSRPMLESFANRYLHLDWIDLMGWSQLKGTQAIESYNLLRPLDVYPVEQENCGIKIAFCDPFDCDCVDRVEALLGEKVIPCWASLESIRGAWAKALGEYRESEEPDCVDAQSPARSLLDAITVSAIKESASDIHFDFCESGFLVRFRLDGALKAFKRIALDESTALLSYIKLVSGMDIAERRLPQEGRMLLADGSVDLDLRVSVIPSSEGESIVIRMLERIGYRKSFLELGFDTDQENKLVEWLQSPDGLTLVTGPTGSGKTTTLYAILNELNPAEHKMITVEDPVEYYLPGASQVNVNGAIGLDFASVLRSVLRQAPDTILIGEIRDAETAGIAINAAITGHRVLSSLHTQDTVGAIIRLIDMGVAPYLLAAALRGVIAQRLVRKACSDCCSKENVLEVCMHCSGLGFQGRVGCFELLSIDSILRGLIYNKASKKELYAAAIEAGMVPLKAIEHRQLSKGMSSVGVNYASTCG